MTINKLKKLIHDTKPKLTYRIVEDYATLIFFEYAKETYILTMFTKSLDITIDKVSNGDLEEMACKRMDSFGEITARTTDKIRQLN